MRCLNNTDKIKFYVPEHTAHVIRSDAEQFEVYKSNGEEPNLNRFLSMLLVGYFKHYQRENQETRKAIQDTISPYLKNNNQKNQLTEQLMEQIIHPDVSRKKGRHSVTLSLKPTYETDWIITEINQSLNGTNDYISQYLRRMLMRYCEKPIYEREKIAFRENAEFLEEACSTQKEITFTITNNPRQTITSCQLGTNLSF